LPDGSLLVAELLPVGGAQNELASDLLDPEVEESRGRVAAAERRELLAQRDPDGV
jgi:hypothetical protein